MSNRIESCSGFFGAPFALFLLLSLAPLESPSADPGEARWTLATGVVSLAIKAEALAGIGVVVLAPGEAEARGRPAGTLQIDAGVGDFDGFANGSLIFEGGPRLKIREQVIDLSSFVIAASSETRWDLAVKDFDGKTWFRLRMGHHWLDHGAGQLRSEFMDIRPGEALLEAIGTPLAASVFLGTAALAAPILETDAFARTDKALCQAPAWPDGESRFVDLLMVPEQRESPVSETSVSIGRSRGKVYMTPSARFRMIGNADTPWYSRFVTPDIEGDCVDDGTGQCEPYGISAGGFLVWNIYYLDNDGLLQQVGRSGVKHAFNSINDRSSDPAFECSCRTSSRVAFAGCEDLYSASTNANGFFLGPRDEIEASEVSWESCGSVFDRDCDQVCDRTSSGLIKCLVEHDDDTTYQAGVDAQILQRDGRFFVESWYLVRDDIDTFNSMSSIEVDPVFNDSGAFGQWIFPDVGEFALGTTLGRIAGEAGRAPQLVQTDIGRVLLDARSVALEDGWVRYVYTIMNIDFDPQINQLTVPLFGGAAIRNPQFTGIDGVSTTDWLTEMGSEHIAWRAPSDEALDWGTMVTFTFESDQAAAMGTIGLGDAGNNGGLFSQAPRPMPDSDLIHGSGFESGR